MRNLLIVSGGLVLLVAAVACESGPGQAKEPPVLHVTSPARSLVQGHAGPLMVSGTVEPNASGDAIEKVLVNDVQATVEADGSFHALIDLPVGATLIETVARDANGSLTSDTRAVHAGPLRPVGTSITNAVTAALSADAFARISAAAGPILKGLDMGALLAPLQPMVHINDPDGEDCAFARLFIDDLEFSDIKISLAPVQGGLAFTAQVDGVNVPAHARWAILCADGSNTLRITASRIVVAGTLNVTPNGMAGFTTKLTNPQVSVTGFHFTASGIPGEILSLFHLDTAIQAVVSKGAELAMGPLVNMALGALGGPQRINVLGKQLEMQVAPSAITFTPGGARLAMSMRALLAGSESSPGFVFTDNGTPTMTASRGFQLGLADDLANEMLAELGAIGVLNLAMPTPTPAFDETRIQMSLPPMISADADSGELRLVLGDMMATYTRQGTPVAKAAINATVDLKISPAGNGYLVALQLGTPSIHVNVVDDIANATGLEDKDLATATAASIAGQIASISALLAAIPVPAIAGLQVHDLSIASDDGYVMVTGVID
jgi:Glucodextranase, domain B